MTQKYHTDFGWALSSVPSLTGLRFRTEERPSLPRLQNAVSRYSVYEKIASPTGMIMLPGRSEEAKLLLNGEACKPSENDYDWLGKGIYFSECARTAHTTLRNSR